MIKLEPQFQTVISTTFNGQSETVTTDTLFVGQIGIDFSLGTISATIFRGTQVNGQFAANQPPVVITANPDGSFSSSDGSWSGNIADIPGLLSSLKTQFDQLVLASGKVMGSAI